MIPPSEEAVLNKLWTWPPEEKLPKYHITPKKINSSFNTNIKLIAKKGQFLDLIYNVQSMSHNLITATIFL